MWVRLPFRVHAQLHKGQKPLAVSDRLLLRRRVGQRRHLQWTNRCRGAVGISLTAGGSVCCFFQRHVFICKTSYFSAFTGNVDYFLQHKYVQSMLNCNIKVS